MGDFGETAGRVMNRALGGHPLGGLDLELMEAEGRASLAALNNRKAEEAARRRSDPKVQAAREAYERANRERDARYGAPAAYSVVAASLFGLDFGEDLPDAPQRVW